MNDLERRGLSTFAIRNRARRRNADFSRHFCNCFGTPFSFADFTRQDREAHKEYQKLVYQEQKKVRFHSEEKIRLGFNRKLNVRKNVLDEAFEVVD